MFRPNGSVAMSSRTWSSQLLNIYEPIRSWDDIKHEFLLVNVLRLQFTIIILFSSKTFQSETFRYDDDYDATETVMLVKNDSREEHLECHKVWNKLHPDDKN